VRFESVPRKIHTPFASGRGGHVRLVTVDPAAPDPGAIREAARLLRGGALVAFPTETVYGLGANALDEAAVRRIFAAKGRPAYNPLIAHVADAEDARRYAAVWPAAAERLARRFWPGPLTLVVPKRPEIPDAVTAGLGSVALRVPSHPVAHALVAAAGVPVAAPSANRYTAVSPTTAQHVAAGLGEAVAMILDAGPTSVGIESTVVDLSGERPTLLRPGTIPPSELEAVVGPLARPEAIAGAAPRPGPGMVRRHYSPSAELRLYPRDERDRMADDARAAVAAEQRVGGMLLLPLAAPLQHPILMPDDAAGYAREIYAALHRLDDAGCDVIVADEVPEGPEWTGVRDRLARAAER
jgi:L-threonylcarbamoyladenylate synthase